MASLEKRVAPMVEACVAMGCEFGGVAPGDPVTAD